MSAPTLITTIPEARAALDEQISYNRSLADYSTRESEKNLATASRYSGIAYELERLRKRMDERMDELAAVGVERGA